MRPSEYLDHEFVKGIIMFKSFLKLCCVLFFTAMFIDQSIYIDSVLTFVSFFLLNSILCIPLLLVIYDPS